MSSLELMCSSKQLVTLSTRRRMCQTRHRDAVYELESCRGRREDLVVAFNLTRTNVRENFEGDYMLRMLELMLGHEIS